MLMDYQTREVPGFKQIREIPGMAESRQFHQPYSLVTEKHMTASAA